MPRDTSFRNDTYTREFFETMLLKNAAMFKKASNKDILKQIKNYNLKYYTDILLFKTIQKEASLWKKFNQNDKST